MREIVVYTVVLLVLALGFEYLINTVKHSNCVEAGGEFYYNASDANLSFCKVKENK